MQLKAPENASKWILSLEFLCHGVSTRFSKTLLLPLAQKQCHPSSQLLSWHMDCFFFFMVLLTLARPARLSSGPWWIGRDGKRVHTGCFPPPEGRGSPPLCCSPCHGSRSLWPHGHPDPPLSLRTNTRNRRVQFHSTQSIFTKAAGVVFNAWRPNATRVKSYWKIWVKMMKECNMLQYCCLPLFLRL